VSLDTLVGIVESIAIRRVTVCHLGFIHVGVTQREKVQNAEDFCTSKSGLSHY